MTVVLKINGVSYEGWKQARVTRAMDRAAGDFDVTVSQPLPATATVSGIKVGDKCSIEVLGQPLITGYVDDVEPRYDSTTHEITVRGRSKTCDLIDCAAMNKPGQWRGLPLLDIAKAIAKPFSVAVKTASGVTTKPVADFQIQQGETAYAAIERLCRLQGFLVSDDEEGNLVITRVGTERSAGTIQCIPLGIGNNVLSGSATFSGKERFSDYIVKGQSAGSDDVDGETARSSMASLKDSNVTRYRPMLVVAEGQSSSATARDRAAWERSTRAANSIQLQYSVAGWTANPAGEIWRTNTMVPVQDSLLGVNGEFCVAEVTFQMGENGSTTALRLAPPDSFKPEPETKDIKKKTKASESVDSWGDTDE